MEPQWNPAAEAQAIDRVHRLGQEKAVVTVRYIMNDSFEGKILEMQKKKTDLANMTMAQGKKLNKNEISKQRLEVCLPPMGPAGVVDADNWVAHEESLQMSNPRDEQIELFVRWALSILIHHLFPSPFFIPSIFLGYLWSSWR